MRIQNTEDRRQNCVGTPVGLVLSSVFCLLTPFVGCIGSPQNPAATQPVTISDPATTQPGYWFDQPGTATVEASDFELLTQRILRTLRDYSFKIDRVDYRLGLITTEPMVAAQFYEPWRRDNQTLKEITWASLATYRRTVEVLITRNDSGTFIATPKVLIERETVVERRTTSVVLYKGIFKTTPSPKDKPSGTKESDQGIFIPSKDWYAVARDEPLEKKLAEEIRSSLK